MASSGVMGSIADAAGTNPLYPAVDFRTGQDIEPSIQELTFADEAERIEQARLERMSRAWAYYHGQHHRPLEATLDGFNDNVLVNKALTVVDKGVAFLFGKPFRLFDGAEDASGAASGSADAAPAADEGSASDTETEAQEVSPVTVAIEQILQANKGMQVWQDAALNGGVCGHAWLKVQPRKGRPPRFVVLDPQGMRVVTHDDDIDKVLEYVQTWQGVSSVTGKPFARRQRTIDQNENLDETGPWLVVDERSDGDGPWIPLGPPVQWDFEWPPIIGCKNLPAPNEFYGMSDIPDDVLDLNDAVNYAESNTQRVFRLHGHPHMWATNMQGQSVDLAPDTIAGLPEGATVDSLEMSSDQHGAQQFADRLGQAIHEQTRVPMIATGRIDKVGVLSGLALKVLYAPLVEKTEQKQGLYGWLVVEATKRALELMGLGKAEMFDLELEWPETVPTDAKEEREVALLDNELGASKATLLERLGYDPDSEAAKRADEAEAGIDAAQRAFNEGGGQPFAGGNNPPGSGGANPQGDE